MLRFDRRRDQEPAVRTLRRRRCSARRARGLRWSHPARSWLCRRPPSHA